jgi:hypothetical protein
LCRLAPLANTIDSSTYVIASPGACLRQQGRFKEFAAIASRGPFIPIIDIKNFHFTLTSPA